MATPALDSPHSIHQLYSDHHGWLTQWLRRRLGCAENAADLAQDTFVRLVAKPRELHQVREPKAYLHTIANGLLANFWRRRDIERAYLDALALQPEACAPSPETRALIFETLVQVDTLLHSLPERVRRAFLLSQLHGLTYAAIAAELGVSERMIKKYMAQAMLQCLLLLED